MKIKFIKEYRAIGDFGMPGKAIIARSFIGDTADNLDDEDAQWLIDSGFAEEVKELDWKKPDRGDSYYFINSSGVIVYTAWVDSPQDRIHYLMGNYFRTTEAAERYGKYLQAVATVRQDEGVLTPEQINELEGKQGKAYHVGYMGKQNGEEVLCGCLIDLYETWAPVGTILFDTEEHADASRKEHQEEWKIIASYDWSRE